MVIFLSVMLVYQRVNPGHKPAIFFWGGLYHPMVTWSPWGLMAGAVVPQRVWPLEEWRARLRSLFVLNGRSHGEFRKGHDQHSNRW